MDESFEVFETIVFEEEIIYLIVFIYFIVWMLYLFDCMIGAAICEKRRSICDRLLARSGGRMSSFQLHQKIRFTEQR